MEFRRWLSFAIPYRIYLFPAFRSSSTCIRVRSVECIFAHCTKPFVGVWSWTRSKWFDYIQTCTFQFCDKRICCTQIALESFNNNKKTPFLPIVGRRQTKLNEYFRIKLTSLIKKTNGFRQIAKSFYRPWENKNIHPIYANVRCSWLSVARMRKRPIKIWIILSTVKDIVECEREKKI